MTTKAKPRALDDGKREGTVQQPWETADSTRSASPTATVIFKMGLHVTLCNEKLGSAGRSFSLFLKHNMCGPNFSGLEM